MNLSILPTSAPSDDGWAPAPAGPDRRLWSPFFAGPSSQQDGSARQPRVTTGAAEQGPPAEAGRSSRWRRWLAACTVTPPMWYPHTFLVFSCLVCLSAALWLVFYFLRVLPLIEDYNLEAVKPCNYDDTIYYVHMLLIYFGWFAIARALLFVPCVGTRAMRILLRRRSFFHAYAIHVIMRDGPLYVFLLHSWFFWLNILQGPPCKNPDGANLKFQGAMKEYAVCGNCVSLLCLVLANWHNKLLLNRAGAVMDVREGLGRVPAPAETLTKLETCVYDEASFGDEDSKPYPSECAICLAVWEADDTIKVTPCGHAFHEECISNWLRSARTCALCRRDLTAATAASSATQRIFVGGVLQPSAPRQPSPVAPSSPPSPLPGAIGAPQGVIIGGAARQNAESAEGSETRGSVGEPRFDVR